MIKNVIFDLGNVLISFKPSDFFETKGYSDIIKNKIIKDIFESDEWKKLDDGVISTNEAIDSIASVSSLKKEEIAYVFRLRTDIMFPLDQNARMLPELKKQGFNLYFLSNFSIDIFEEVRSGYYFFNYFKGGIISSEVKVSKPDLRIYKILIEKYSLDPSECLFIDDIELNVRAAEKIGMKGLFTSGSPDISTVLKKSLGIRGV